MASSDWQVLIGTLGAVVITGGIGLLTAVLTHRWQRETREEARRQVRSDHRRSVYVAYLVQAQRLGDETVSWVSTTGKGLAPDLLVDAYFRDLGESAHAHDSCERHALLAAGPEVREALETYRAWYQEALKETFRQESPGLSGWEEKERPLLDAMREELDNDMVIRDSPVRKKVS